MGQLGPEVVNQYLSLKSLVELKKNEIDELRQNLVDHERELDMFISQINNIQKVAPELIKQLEKEYEMQ